MTPEQLKKVLDDHHKWLRGAGGSRANLRGADLQGVNLQGVNLRGADLQGVNLQGADLQGVNLQGVNLRDADLRGADLRDADLRGADLRDADLRGANLREANLQGANLAHCLGDDASRLGFALLGLRWPVWISPDRKMLAIGCQKHSVEEWREFTDEEIRSMSSCALSFWRENKSLILGLANDQDQ